MIGGRIHLETSLITICTYSPELTAIPQRSQFPQPLAQAGTSSVHQPGALGEAHFDAALWSLAPISPKLRALKSAPII